MSTIPKHTVGWSHICRFLCFGLGVGFCVGFFLFVVVFLVMHVRLKKEKKKNPAQNKIVLLPLYEFAPSVRIRAGLLTY